MMASQLILSELEKGRTEGINKEVLEYLAPILCDDSDHSTLQDVKPYGLFAVKFLHCSVSALQSGVTSTSLLEAVETCYRCYSKIRDDIKLSEPLSVQKLLYHILNKISQKSYLENVCRIANFLYEELLPLPDISTGTAVTIVSSAFSLLWNLSIKLEQEKDFVDFHQTLTLRYTALKIMLLKKNSSPAVIEKFLLTVTRFDKMLQQSKEMQKKGSRPVTFDLCYSIINTIIDRSTTSQTGSVSELNLSGIISVFQYMVKSFLQNKSYDEAENILMNIDNVCTKLKSHGETVHMIELLSNIYRMLFYCVCVEENCGGGVKCDFLGLSEQVVTDSKEMADIPLSWHLTISDILLVFLKYIEPKNITNLDHTRVLLEVFVSLVSMLAKQYQPPYKERNCKPSCKLKGDNPVVSKGDNSTSTCTKDDGSLCVKMVSVLGFYLKVAYKFLQHCKEPDIRKKHLEGARDTAEIYTWLLDAEYPDNSADMLDKERHFCGYLMSRYGHFCSGLEQTDMIVYFYTKACDQLTKWVQSDETQKQKRIIEVSLGRSYECLADAQKKSQSWEAAQDTVANCLLVDSSLVHTAVKFWVRMKKEAMKLDITEIDTSSLADVVARAMPDYDVHSLLKLELQHLQSSRKRFYDAEMLILTKLCDAAKTTLQKAEAYCGIGRHMWLTNVESDRTPEDYFLDAENILHKCKDPSGQALRGELCLWLYILQHEKTCKELIENPPKAMECDNSEPGEESENNSPVITNSTYSFTMEMKTMTKLDQAVEFWGGYLSSDIKKEDAGIHSSLQQSMMTCAALYRIAGKFDREHRTLGLLMQYYSLLGCDVPSVVLCQLCDIYLHVGMYDAAEKFLSELPDSNVMPTFDESYIQLIMTKTKYCLYSKQIDEGLGLLHSLLDTVSSQPDRSCSVFLSDGTARRMLSVFLGIPGEHTETMVTHGYSLELALDAVRLHTGVTQYLLGEKSWLTNKEKGVKSLDKWKVLQEFLESLLHLGRLYRLAGEAREAKCYLKEGWETSHFMGLPKWTVDFLVELTKIHNLSDNVEASAVCMNDLKRLYQLEHGSYVNETTETTSKEKSRKNESCKEKNRKGKKMPKSSVDCFGFDGDEEKDEKGDEKQELGNVNIPCLDHMTIGKPCDLCSDPSVLLCLLSTSTTFADSQCAATERTDDISIVDTIENTKILAKVKVYSCMQFDGNRLNLWELNLSKSPKLTEILIENLTLKAEGHLQDGEMIKCTEVVSHALQIIESVQFSSQNVSFLHCRLLLCQAQAVYINVDNKIILGENNSTVDRSSTVTSLEIDDQSSTCETSSVVSMEGGKCNSTVETDDVTERLANLNMTSEPKSNKVLPCTNKSNKQREKENGSFKRKSNDSEKLKEEEPVRPHKTVMRKAKSVKSKSEKLMCNETPKDTRMISGKCKSEEIDQVSDKLANIRLSKTGKRTGNKEALGERELQSQKKFSKITKRDTSVESSDLSSCPTESSGTNLIEAGLTTPRVKCKLSIKTPHSVSSRKAALDLLLDSSDEEEMTTKRRGRGRGRAKSSQTGGRPGKKSIDVKVKDTENKTGARRAPCMNLTERMSAEKSKKLEKDSDEVETLKPQCEETRQTNKTTGRSRIPRLMNKTNQLPKTKSAKVGEKEGDNSCVGKNEKESKISTGKNVLSVQRKIATSARSKNKTQMTDIECEREGDQLDDNVDKNIERDIFEFDEEDPINTKCDLNSKLEKTEKSKSVKGGKLNSEKATRTRSTRVKKGKNQNLTENQERARSCAVDDVEKIFSLDDSMENYFDQSQLLSDSYDEFDSSKYVVMPAAYGDSDSTEFVDYILTEEMTEENLSQEDIPPHDESIEILRGGVDKKSANKKSQNPRRKKTEVQQDMEMDSEMDKEEGQRSMISTLEKAYSQLQHFPAVGLHTSICNMLALQYIDRCPLKAAFYMTEAIAVTFRHQSLINYSKKIRKSKKSDLTPSKNEAQLEAQRPGSDNNTDTTLQCDVEQLQKMHSELLFRQKPDDLKAMISSIPDGWTVCQVSMVTSPHTRNQVLLNRLTNNTEPVVVSLPCFSNIQGREILSEFSSIMAASHESMKVTEKNEWWTQRIQLNDRLNGLLENLEKYWLSHWKCLMYGNPVMTKEEKKKLQNLTDSICADLYKTMKVKLDTVKLQCVLQASHIMADHQLSDALSHVTGIEVTSEVNRLVSVIRTETAKLKFLDTDNRRSHTVLILDKNLQHLPWESIPMLRSCSVTRVASLYHLCTQLSHLHTQKTSVFQKGIDPKNVFYILNPDNNLFSTQETFESQFTSKECWEGIVNNQPTVEQYKIALTQKDLLLYCGHGSGSKYFQGDNLAKLQCRAAAVLMGCSSGKLVAKGKLEVSGMMLNYFLSGCPCVVANLWDVTDKDIDRFLENLLSMWMTEDSTPSECSRSMSEFVPSARDACRLPYLIGAAPVVYGFPVSLQPS